MVLTGVQSGWPIASMDVSQAFLRGLTFEEAAKIRGSSVRRVSLRLPWAKNGEPSGSSVLRCFAGFETFLVVGISSARMHTVKDAEVKTSNTPTTPSLHQQYKEIVSRTKRL